MHGLAGLIVDSETEFPCGLLPFFMKRTAFARKYIPAEIKIFFAKHCYRIFCQQKKAGL